ncbi:Rieske 2Fe-2S domain-containing protein [Natronorubrum sp. JWXQ-INN-674]|uniref:Rieske 2Fe-2S domain-containing protein n=1 Tax=Natronorubrum halalkaliphilum TaxID=2691917 RepID=A0A6B0VTA5_9EURY|nr:Rieske 2Fe-2S domain-containing protein [Natronorubrum halalkaliphilum]MXV63769.1 Rieske 2Fe-2S domain-containing protein [Natronorubrum halalkaliphilum]
MDASQRIAALEDVPADSTHLFRVTNGTGEQQEAILVASGAEEDGGCGSDDRDDRRLDGDDETPVSCWLNYCQHLTHIKIDKGSGAPMRDGELVCANHGAYFDAGSGQCTHGPCEGAYLSDLEVDVRDGNVYLTDDDYEFVGDGPLDDDGDMTSTSNVKI